MGLLQNAAMLAKFGAVIAARRAKSGKIRPGWSFGYEVVAHAMKERSRRIATLGWLEQRAAWKEMVMPSPVSGRVEVKEVDADGVRALVTAPRGISDQAPLVVYLHGGGYIYGSIDTHAELIARIALASGARVAALDYRQAPEHPFPAPIEDATRALRWAARTVGSSRVVLAGDSAGGGLAVAAMVANKDVLPAGAALLCPWVDLAARGGSLEENARYDWAEPEYFQRWAAEYLRGGDERDPRASPIYADLRGLPPLLIQVGGAEMLRDQAVAFAARAREAEVPVLLEVWPDMVHDWHVLASMFSVSRRAIDRIGAFVRERTTGS